MASGGSPELSCSSACLKRRSKITSRYSGSSLSADSSPTAIAGPARTSYPMPANHARAASSTMDSLKVSWSIIEPPRVFRGADSGSGGHRLLGMLRSQRKIRLHLHRMSPHRLGSCRTRYRWHGHRGHQGPAEGSERVPTSHSPTPFPAWQYLSL